VSEVALVEAVVEGEDAEEQEAATRARRHPPSVTRLRPTAPRVERGARGVDAWFMVAPSSIPR
jgi:hypothetical protein